MCNKYKEKKRNVYCAICGVVKDNRDGDVLKDSLNHVKCSNAFLISVAVAILVFLWRNQKKWEKDTVCFFLHLIIFFFSFFG